MTFYLAAPHLREAAASRRSPGSTASTCSGTCIGLPGPLMAYPSTCVRAQASLQRVVAIAHLAPQAYGDDWPVQLPCPDLPKYLGTGTDLMAGAVEIAPNGLDCAAEMTREKRLGNGDVR